MSVTSTGPGGQGLNTYTYDAAGNTDSRQEDASTQQLTWDEEGHLVTVSDPETGATSFISDADGNRLIRKTAQGTTLVRGETETTLTSNGQCTADRYYTQPGTPTVIRTTDSSDMSVMLPDLHDTATTAVSSAPGMPIPRRKITPTAKTAAQHPNCGPASAASSMARSTTPPG